MVKGRIAEGYNRCFNVIDLGVHKIYVSLSQIFICVATLKKENYSRSSVFRIVI